MADYTTTTLLARAKLYGAVPVGQPAFTNAQMLNIMTDELRSVIAPLIHSLREDYFVTYQDFDITTSESQTFNIPSRALGMALKDVKLVDPNDENHEINISRIDVGDKQEQSAGYYIKDNQVILINPDNFSNYNLRLYFYQRPSELKAVTDCAKVSVIGSVGVTVESVPSSWGSNQIVDVVQANPPFKILTKDNSAVIISNNITMTVHSDLAVGDYICLSNESPVAQIPYEAHDLLVQSSIIRFMEILADKKGIELAMNKYIQLERAVKNLLSPRVTGDLKIINNYDSFLNGSSNRGWIV